MYVDINADLCNKYDLSQYYTKSKLTKFLRINGKVRCFLLIDQIATQKKTPPPGSVKSMVFRRFPTTTGPIMLGTFPKVISQAVTSQGYFPK